jgi:hypothetical protein
VNLTDDANNRRDAVYESSSEAVKIYRVFREFREFREKCVYVCMLWVCQNIGASEISPPVSFFQSRSLIHFGSSQ